MQWLLDTGAAISVEVDVFIPALNAVQIAVDINGDETVEFLENWKAAA